MDLKKPIHKTAPVLIDQEIISPPSRFNLVRLFQVVKFCSVSFTTCADQAPSDTDRIQYPSYSEQLRALVRMQDLHCQSVPDAELGWLPSCSLEKIKKESSEPEVPLIYSPYSPDNPLYSNHPHSRSSPAPLTNRVRPSSFNRPDILPRPNLITMTSASTSNWSSPSGMRSARSNTSAHRSQQPGNGNDYSLGQPFMSDGTYTMRPESSRLTSSLTGAIGDTVHRNSRSPPIRNDSLYHSSDWTMAQPTILHGISSASPYPGVAGMNSLTFEMSTSNLNYDPTTMRNSSPESTSSGSSTYGSTLFDPYPQHRVRQTGSGYPMPTQSPHTSFSAEDSAKVELTHLRQKLREAEAETARYRAALEEMRTHGEGMSPGQIHTILPTPPPSASFQENWKVRTEVRRKMFCSLNRAGNALCAWHDSRRERRSYPPRNAPPGYLNCGCTHEEALFEESLARHNVGSYYPGESVRMDPALRNPLLKLLQQRYGYQDGDFERDPATGQWIPGEGAAFWEAQVHAGSSSRRRLETDRH